MSKKTILIFCTSLLHFFVFSEQTLTVEKAVESALQNNISLKQSQIQLNSLKRAKNTSWNSIHPSIGLNGSLTFPMPDDASHDNPATDTKYRLTLSGSVSIALTPAIYSAIKSASLNYENGKLTYEQASRGIELNVRIAFYGLLYEKEQISMQERNVETARQQYEQTRTRYQNGRASELDLLSSQISYESLLPNLQSVRLTFDKDLSLFKQTIGINQSEKINLQGSLSDAIILNNFKSDFSTSEMPSVKQAANNVALSKAALLARRLTAYGPTLTAGWSYGKTKSEGSDKWQTGDSISLGVQIPLDGFLPWTRTGQTVSDAKDSVKSAELALENAIISAEVQTNDYINQIKQKQAQLEVLKSNVELAQKSYDMMLNAYNHGTRDFLNLQTALNSLMSARLNLAAQEYSLITALLNLEYSLGIPFGTLGK